MLKSQLIQFILTLLFGPLGLFYSSAMGAILLCILAVLAGVPSAGIGAIAVWPLSIIVGIFTTRSHNKKANYEHAKHEEIVEAARGGRE